MLGCHASGTGSFRFENVELLEDQLLVPPGQGFRAAMEGIDIARITVAAMCSKMLEMSLDVAVKYTKKRQAFGSPIATKQGLQWMLADVATDLEASLALTEQAASALDVKDPSIAIKAAHAKKFSTRVTMDGLSQCMQALGANGFRQEEHPLARHLASAKMAQYLDGTTEIMNVVLA